MVILTFAGAHELRVSPGANSNVLLYKWYRESYHISLQQPLCKNTGENDRLIAFNNLLSTNLMQDFCF